MLPRTVTAVRHSSPRADVPKVDELLFTGPKSVVVSDVKNCTPHPNLETDKRGSVSLMAAVERGAPGIVAERGTTRLVVVGDSFLWGNQSIESVANRELASYTVNWLLDQTALLSDVPKQ